MITQLFTVELLVVLSISPFSYGVIQQSTDLTCGFETPCRWRNGTNGVDDQFDWLIANAVILDSWHSIPRSRKGNGDLFAYTQGNGNLQKHDDTALLISEVIPCQVGVGTLTFYFWKTALIPSLQVCVRKPPTSSGHLNCIESIHGVHRQEWVMKTLTIPADNEPFEIVFKAAFHQHFDIIGLDDISYEGMICRVRKRLKLANSYHRSRWKRQSNLPITANSTIGTTSDNRGGLRVEIPHGAKVTVHNGLLVLAEAIDPIRTTVAPAISLLNDSAKLTVLSDTHVVDDVQPLASLLNFASVKDNLYTKLIPNLLLNIFKKDTINSESGNGGGTTTNPGRNPPGTGNGQGLCPAVDCNFDKSSLCAYQSSSGSGGGDNRSWQLSSTQVANSLTGIFKDVSGSGTYAYAGGTDVAKTAVFTLESPSFVTTQEAQLSFNYYLAGIEGRLRACVDSLSNCQFTQLGKDIKADARQWKPGRISVPSGTRKVIFVADQFQKNYVVGLDEISLVQSGGGTTQVSCT